ncbi:hypothetical protein NP236_23420 [Salmonella enterica]|nr:hypothetical protein [Salmonella enterica]
MPKFPMPPKCSNKNNTVVKNNTSEATTEAPLTDLTTASSDPNSTLSQADTTISSNASNVIETSSVPPEETNNTTAIPEPETSESTTAPVTQATTQDKASQILSDLSKLWQHILSVLQEP